MGKIWMLLRYFREKEILVYAAYASFFLILSAFPTLVLLLGLLRYTSLQAMDLLDLLGGFLPVALLPQAWELIGQTYRNTSKIVLSVSALTALWSAGKGLHGLMKGLNRIYGVCEHRGWLRTRIMCVGYMVLFLGVLILTLILHVFGNTLVAYLRLHGEPEFLLWMELLNLRFFLLVALQTGLFCVMLMYLPGKNNGFRESLPGALLASVGWMGVSYLFSVYVENDSGYSIIFGPVYAVAFVMLWLYACVSIIFLGAALNRMLSENARK